MPGWTLNFEMLFYLLISVALWVHRRGYVSLVSLVLLLVYALGRLCPPESVGQAFFHDSLWLEFILGMACFRMHRHPWIRAVPTTVHAFVIVGAAWFVVEWEGSFDRFLVAGLPCFLIVLSALQLEDVLRKTDSRFLAFLVHIGDASYATYLSHMFVIGTIERIFFRLFGIQEKSLATAVFTIACCLVVGSLIYRFVDLPMVQRARRLTRRVRPALS
jgi:peptidoglycan/LPS O-acetylase OafA/YrhL